MKRFKIATLALLLVIQVLFSPFSAFAEPDVISSPPASGEGAEQLPADDAQTGEDDYDQDNVTSDEEAQQDNNDDAAQDAGGDATDDAATEDDGLNDDADAKDADAT